MWKAYLFVLVVVSVNGPLEGRRSNSDASDRGCRRTNSESHRLCTKSCSSDKDCRENRKCLCDGDCGLSCAKPNLNCGYPPKPRNSIRRMTNGTVFNSVVTYTCKKPYELRGSAKRTCRAIEKWDGKNARCKIFCDDPGDIKFGGRRAEKNSLQAGRGGFLQYWCGSDYKLKGKEIIHCQENGKWSAPKPECVLPECDPPSVPDSASVIYPRKMPKKHRYNDRVILKCKVGYFKSGFGYMQCDKGNTWRGSIICRPKSCGDPGKPDNGAVKGRVYLFKSKIEYECDKGYQLKGPAYRNCQANQIWSGRQPTCEVVDCGNLDEPIKGEIIESVGTTFGKRIVFRCNDIGYEIKGSAQRTCQSDGSWSGSKTTCELVTCSDPGKPENGKQIVSRGYVYGGTVKFVCDKDYTLRGKDTMYCQADKNWRGSVPACLAPCSDPGVPYQGDRIIGGLRHDQTVTFTCPRDYVMKGARTITCSNGRWSNEKPSCLAPCGDPGSPKNGWKFGRDYIHEKSVRFRCNRGYQRIGAEIISCQNGRWSNKAPVCKGICRKPSTPYNGFLHGKSYLDGDEVTFTCKRGYDLFGGSKLRCFDRSWDLREPECKGRCTFSGSPDNGYYRGNKRNKGDMVRHGKTITYDCDVLYTMEGAYQQRCENGRWNNDSPRCKAPCINPGDITHGRKTGNDYRHGKTVVFVCDGKFSLEGNSRLKCDNGNWNADSPKCKASCRDPLSPVNGNRIGDDFKHGSWVSFSCDAKHRLVGKKSLTCIDGSWSDSLPTCVVLCSNPGQPVHGRRLGIDFLDGETVNFICNNNYDLIGSKTLRCNGGKWSDKIPECRGRCNFLGNPFKGYEENVVHRIGEALPHGSHVEYACEPKHTLVGSKVLYCIDESWNASVPTCKAPCADPGNLQRGSREGNNLLHGHTVTYKCFERYSLVGKRQLTCNDGHWNSKLPECKESCQAVEALDHGTVHGNSFNHGEVVSFSCDIGYKLSGSRGVICADGIWNDSSPTCKGACQNPGIFEHGSITGKDYSYGSSISFSCDNGYDLRGSKNLTCNKGVWSHHTPVCRKRCNNPGKISNGLNIGVNFTHGGTIAFTCYTGTSDTLDVIGAPKITCKDGQWSAPMPSCQARCTDPGRPDNGEKNGSDYRSGATVTFKCNPTLQLEGDQIITCNSGKWSGSRPRCSACGSSLEIENYKTTDWRRRPSPVRLHGPSSWCTSRAGAYLQIDLDKPYKLTAIATQGSQDLDKWVSNYRIEFRAGADFLFYRESSGFEKVIQGNTDATAVTKYNFKRPFIAQNVRIYPVVERDRHCLKTELYGCSPPPGCILIGSMFWGKWKRNYGADNYYKAYITKLDDSKFEFELLINAKQTRTYYLNASVLIIDEIPAPTDISVDSKVIALHNPQYPDWFQTGTIERIDLSNRSPYFVRFENNQLRWVAREDLRLVRRPRIC